jgi:mRNA interferase MazF
VSAFERFAVVRVPFPFTDRQAQKRRPALVLSLPGFQQACGHVLLAMITSARRSSWPLDWPIEDLRAAGLPKPPELMPRDPLVFRVQLRLGQ